MGTSLRVHTKLEFLHPINGSGEKLSRLHIPKGQDHYIRFLSRRRTRLASTKNNGFVRARSSALLELVPETKKKNLVVELPLYDSSKAVGVDLAVVGGGPTGLAVAQQVSEASLSVCSIDPSPKLIWPNNYGVWVDEFEALDLLDCHDATWSGAVVYINDGMKKSLNRPYGRVDRK